jgi:geranylgeranyl diphosphate synthase, type II
MQHSGRMVEEVLSRYAAITRPALLGYLPSHEPRRYLYDIVPDYVLRGGKMLRSGLCIAVCRAFGGEIEGVLESAVAIELLHNAFLIHDDIEDGSEQRRGQPTLHELYGLPLALNAGDALSLLSIEPLLRNVTLLGPELAWQIVVETLHVARQAVEGQAVELGWRQENADDVTVEDYLGMVLKKTCLYTTILPCRVGAMVALRRPVAPDFAVRFGLLLGGAFQIWDDIANVATGDGSTGKEWADDIFEGKRSLMLIHLLERLRGRDRARLRCILDLPRQQREPEQVAWVLDRMHSCGSIEVARLSAVTLAVAASVEFDATFGALPDSEDKQFIRELVLSMVERDV